MAPPPDDMANGLTDSNRIPFEDEIAQWADH